MQRLRFRLGFARSDKRGVLRRVRVALAAAVGLLALVAQGSAAAPLGGTGVGVGDAAAAGGARIGVSEDAPKFAKDGGASLYAQMEEIGLGQNVVSAIWTAGRDLSVTDIGRINKAVAAGKARGVKVVIAIYPASGANARALGNGGEGAFIDYVKQVVSAFRGTVKEAIVLNEPNRTIFASPVDPALTARVLAAAYDAIKAIDGSVDVIGLGLSPRGTGDGKSLFPVQFLARLGAAYRALNRSAPLMDAISFHPYPFPENKAPDKPSDWPTIGMADLARFKQAIWDAFNGTGQKTVERGLPIHLDEVGYQVPTQGKPGCSAAGGACVVIAGQTALSYLLTAADLGSTIRFEVKGTNAVGSQLETSAATPAITAAGG